MTTTTTTITNSLAKFEALQFIPTYTVLFIVMGILVGLIFYQEASYV